jgi:hypothetical protein
MRFAIATILLFVLASTGSMAEQPNGNHYGNDKNGITGSMAEQPNGNHYGNDKNGISGSKGNNKINASVPAPVTLVLIGIGLAGIVIFRRRKK